MSNSWSHRLVRPLLRPLVGTWVKPDHITVLRAATGVAACLAFAWDSSTQAWAGVIWVLSILIDNADGEFARLSNQVSALGHRLDFQTDLAVNAAMFMALGFGLRHGPFGTWFVVLGLICGVCLGASLYFCETIETRLQPGVIVVAGAGGFDPDDLMYLIGPAAWFGVVPWILIGAGIVLPVITVGLAVWFWRARRAFGGQAALRRATVEQFSGTRAPHPQESRFRSMAGR